MADSSEYGVTTPSVAAATAYWQEVITEKTFLVWCTTGVTHRMRVKVTLSVEKTMEAGTIYATNPVMHGLRYNKNAYRLSVQNKQRSESIRGKGRAPN